MIQEISKREELKAKLEQEGKVHYCDKPEDMEVILAMNERREAFRREYRIKDKKSQNSAAGVILTS